MARTLKQLQTISAGATDVVSINFTDYLDAGELLTGTPTVAEVTTTALTLGNKSVSTAALVIGGVTVAIGMAVQFSVLGQVAGTRYRVRVTVTTTSTAPARIEVVDVLMDCV